VRDSTTNQGSRPSDRNSVLMPLGSGTGLDDAGTKRYLQEPTGDSVHRLIVALARWGPEQNNHNATTFQSQNSS
jgi:hypothetical protein